MLISIVSDLHGYLPEIEDCGLAIICGDICPVHNHDIDFQEVWLREDFNDWLWECPAEEIVLVPGNHDFIFEKYPKIVSDVACVTLIDQLHEYEGLKIWGSPWQLPFDNWAFNLPEEELDKKYSLIPTDTNIIVSHGPPYGFGDLAPAIPGMRVNSEHRGSKSLTDHILRVKPRFVVCGHIHEGYGVYKLQDTTIVNASLMDGSYRPINEPFYFEV